MNITEEYKRKKNKIIFGLWAVGDRYWGRSCERRKGFGFLGIGFWEIGIWKLELGIGN